MDVAPASLDGLFFRLQFFPCIAVSADEGKDRPWSMACRSSQDRCDKGVHCFGGVLVGIEAATGKPPLLGESQISGGLKILCLHCFEHVNKTLVRIHRRKSVKEYAMRIRLPEVPGRRDRGKIRRLAVAGASAGNRPPWKRARQQRRPLACPASKP